MWERRKPWFVLAAVALVFIIGCAGKAPESFISFTTNVTQKDQVGREIPALPGAYSAEPYTWALTPSGGTPPYNCTLVPGSSLPGTLQLIGCTITGTAPFVASDSFFPFTFKITDSEGKSGGPFELSLPVRLRPPVLKVPARLPEAVIGAKYEHVFCDPPSDRELDCGGRPLSKNPSGGVPPYSFSASGLPIGLSMGFNGVLKGAVREGYKPDEYEIEVCVKDSRLFLTCEKTILPVVERAIQFMAPERLPAATIGGLYKYEFCDPTTGGIFDCGFAPIEVGKVGNPSGGTPPYIFSASGLPAGLSMESNGLLTGTVREGTLLGPRAVRICVTDFAGLGTCVDTILEIVAFPRITVSRLPTATIGTWYSFDFSEQASYRYVSGGKPPYKFTVRVTLPRGLRLESNGKLVGTIEPGFRPLGDMEIIICVSDANEYSSCADIILPIADVPTATTPAPTTAPPTTTPAPTTAPTPTPSPQTWNLYMTIAGTEYRHYLNVKSDGTFTGYRTNPAPPPCGCSASGYFISGSFSRTGTSVQWNGVLNIGVCSIGGQRTAPSSITDVGSGVANAPYGSATWASGSGTAYTYSIVCKDGNWESYQRIQLPISWRATKIQ